MARVYKQSAIYDCRAASMRNLFEPSTEYQGKRMEKPNYLITVVIKKTRANWYEEPALASFASSCNELYTAALSHFPFQQVIWPIKDGDQPDIMGKTSEWRTGNWILNGSSTTPIEVFINQGGVPVPLRNRAGVKPGDYVSVTTSIAVKVGDPRGVKCYINKVIFMAEGEEIMIGSGTTSANELMAAAKAQGLNVTGFGGGGAPQQGFAQSLAQPMAGNGPIVGPNVQTMPFPQQSFAPSPVAPPAQQGFGAPGNFNAPSGFPSRS